MKTLASFGRLNALSLSALISLMSCSLAQTSGQQPVATIVQDTSDHYLSMTFLRRINAAALQLNYLPEVSADKVGWSSDSSQVQTVSVAPFDAQFETVTVRDSTSITPSAARFIRLRIVSANIESTSAVWIGSDTVIYGTGGSRSRLTLFSQRMVRPILWAGTVDSLQNPLLCDTNATFVNSQFGTNGIPAYVEFDNGATADIADTAAASQSLILAGSVSGLVSSGDAYRIREHSTIATLFGANNEAGLTAGSTAARADNILLLDPATQRTTTIFYLSNATTHGWALADRSALVPNCIIYPEQGIIVRRIGLSDAHLYNYGLVRTGPARVPVYPGYNLVGTAKSLSSVPLEALNLYTADMATGLHAGTTANTADNLLIIQPNGAAATYFYADVPGVYQRWLDTGRHAAVNVQVSPGTVFIIKRQHPAPFMWTIPGE
jgi:hypothetical protein